MKLIFESVKLGNLTTTKRVIRSATFENAAKDGTITPAYSKLYGDLAKGGVDLIITGMMGVGHNSCVNLNMPQIYATDFVSKMSEITALVHEKGSKIIVQLGHCGYKSTVIDNGDHAQAPSDIDKAKQMTKDEIDHVVTDFGTAALKCKVAGVDGVQIHGAHGYLVSQFLSSYYNKRNDEYGGKIERRARLLFEIYDEIRAKVGDSYPVMIKINHSDLIDGGLTGDESIWVCKQLEKRGIDAIEVSSGIAISKETSPCKIGKHQEGYFGDFALRLAAEIDTPVISVGGYRTLDELERFLNQGNIAAISLCRPFVKEPSILNRWAQSDRTKSQCISCNRCFNPSPIRCMTNI